MFIHCWHLVSGDDNWKTIRSKKLNNFRSKRKNSFLESRSYIQNGIQHSLFRNLEREIDHSKASIPSSRGNGTREWLDLRRLLVHDLLLVGDENFFQKSSRHWELFVCVDLSKFSEFQSFLQHIPFAHSLRKKNWKGYTNFHISVDSFQMINCQALTSLISFGF